MKREKNKKCPNCGSKAIPIVYGLPGGNLIGKSMRGKVKLGGCVISPGNPEWHCPQCGNDFGSLEHRFREIFRKEKEDGT